MFYIRHSKHLHTLCLKKTLTGLLKLVDECRRCSKLKQCRFRDMEYSTIEETISGVYVTPGSAETLVRRGGITHLRSIATSLPEVTKIG